MKTIAEFLEFCLHKVIALSIAIILIWLMISPAIVATALAYWLIFGGC